MKEETISIVTPIYKDSALAENFIGEILKQDFSAIKLEEIIFVVDGSGIEDEKRISELALKYPVVKGLFLSRNFGQHIALSAGYKESKSDYTCMINVDLQDPASEIPILLNILAKDEHDIVYGLREKRKDKVIKRVTSKLFNLTLNYLTGDNTPTNVATLRIMNRKFISAYNQLTEKSRYLPGLEFWLGFRKGYFPIKQAERAAGKSSYSFKKRLFMALESIISFSDLPLRIVTFIGFAIAALGFLLTAYLIVTKLFFQDYQAGYTSTISIIVFLGGIQIFVVGMASVYIGRILKEVQNRPLYVIRDIVK